MADLKKSVRPKSAPKTLREKLLSSLQRASSAEEKEFFKTHPYYGEVTGGKVFINEDKLRQEGSSGDFVEEMLLGESLHKLKEVSPEDYLRLKEAAANDPVVEQWKQDSYKHQIQTDPDYKVDIDTWWDESRLDQVIAGYLLGGPDASLHTVRDWDKESLPFGTVFREELENFESKLDTRGFSEGGLASQMKQTLRFDNPDNTSVDTEENKEAFVQSERMVTNPEAADLKKQDLNLATPPLAKVDLPETSDEKKARVKAATSRRPGFRGDGAFDFSGFASYLKDNVSEEELMSGLNNVGEWMVPFYDAGTNMSNVIGEYSKPEDERDYDYIKEELGKAGTSAAAEGAMWLMGGIVTKYGIKGIKALKNKASQYEIDPNSMSAFGVGAIKKKPSEAMEIGVNEALEGGSFLKSYNSDVSSSLIENAKKANAGNKKANALLSAPVPEGTKVGVRLNLNSSIPNMPKGLDKLQTLHKGSFSGKAMSYLPFATVRNVKFNVSQPGRAGIAARIQGIDTPEAKSKFPAMSVDGSYVPNKNLLDEGGDLVEIGLNPGIHHLFIDMKTGQAVKGASEATVIGDRIYATGVEYWKKAEAPSPKPTQTGTELSSDVRFKFKDGGVAMDDQMQVMFKSRRTGYALGGEVESIDPVSGNEVPPGSTPKEVRDDIPAMLSEGEYVVPADVTRYYGVKFFEDLRANAKVELADMEDNGRIGGEPVPEGEDDLTEDEMALLNQVMAEEEEPVRMAQGGMVGQQMAPSDPYQQQAMMYKEPIKAYAGQFVDSASGNQSLDPFGNPLQQAPQVKTASAIPSVTPSVTPDQPIYGVDTSTNDSPTTLVPRTTTVLPITDVADVPSTGMQSMFYIHRDGRRISVLMYNGKPLGNVPDDFNEFLVDTPENRQSVNFGSTAEGIGVGTEGASVSVEDRGEDNNNDNDNFKINIRTKVDPKTPEGAQSMYEDSGVDMKDPLKGATTALDGSFGISKGAGTFLSAIPGPGTALALLGGIAGGISGISAVSKARANQKMAEFLGDTEAATAIETKIKKYLDDAPGIVNSAEAWFAKGDQRFNNAREAALSLNAPDEAVIYRDKLNEQGKANVDAYLLSLEPEGSTIQADGTIIRSVTNPTRDLKPRMRPTSTATDPLSKTQQPKTTTGADKGTTPGKKASLFYNPEGTNTKYMEFANSLMPNDNKEYVNGVLTDKKTGSAYVAPKRDTVTTTAGRSVVINTNSTKDGTKGAVSNGGQYAGDGFEWKDVKNSDGTVAYTSRTYTGVNEGATGSNDTSSTESGGCFLTTAIVERRGEADNGPTLTTLRNFRDTYLAELPEEVAEYYRVAPLIVASIPKDHKDWDWIGSQIDKAVDFIDRNLLDEAYKTYKGMVTKLKKDWI
mgnify:CR=1 FL=1